MFYTIIVKHWLAHFLCPEGNSGNILVGENKNIETFSHTLLCNRYIVGLQKMLMISQLKENFVKQWIFLYIFC